MAKRRFLRRNRGGVTWRACRISVLQTATGDGLGDHGEYIALAAKRAGERSRGRIQNRGVQNRDSGDAEKSDVRG